MFGGGSNYPPGVTGNEPEIVGYPTCAVCGHDAELHVDDDGEPCPCQETGCGCVEYDQYGDDQGYDGPDEDWGSDR